MVSAAARDSSVLQRGGATERDQGQTVEGDLNKGKKFFECVLNPGALKLPTFDLFSSLPGTSGAAAQRQLALCLQHWPSASC